MNREVVGLFTVVRIEVVFMSQTQDECSSSWRMSAMESRPALLRLSRKSRVCGVGANAIRRIPSREMNVASD